VTSDPFADIDAIDWSSLKHAYGAAHDVPEMLRNLASADPAERDLGLDGLWGAVHHQGDLYDSTIAVIPYLLRAAQVSGFPSCVGVLEVLASIAETWEPAATARNEEHAAWLERSAQAHALLAAAVRDLLPLLAAEDPDVRRAAAELLAYFPDERALIFPAARDALAREGAAAGLGAASPPEISALIDAATGFGSRDELMATETDAWLGGLYQESTEPAERLAMLSRIAARGPAAFPGDLVRSVSELLDDVYARAAEPAPAAEAPSPPPIRPTLVAAVRSLHQEVKAGQRAPWVADLLGDIHRALGTRVAERTALAIHELRAPEWERRYHGVQAANLVISRYRGDHEELVRLVGEQLAHPEERVRRFAQSALRNLGDAAAPARDSLAAHVAEGPHAWSDRGDVSGSVFALAKLRDARVLPAVRWHAEAWQPAKSGSLLGLRRKPEAAQLPASFFGTLRALGPLAAEFTPLLVKLLKIPGPERGYDERETHIAVLGAIGPQAASAVPALLAALQDPRLAAAAAKALDKIAPDLPEVRAAFGRVVEQAAPGHVAAASALARTHPSTELADVLVRHLEDQGRAGLEAARGLDAFTEVQIRLTPAIRTRASQTEDSWGRLAAAIAVHRAEHDTALAVAALAWAWDANESIRAEVARYLPQLGEMAHPEFDSRLDAELADPTRHRYRQFPNAMGTSDVVDDEELLRLCRLARRRSPES
jgi:hypothetical protein